MVESIKVPLLPESVSDAVISKWHKQVGDTVAEGDVVAELETDKIMLDVPSLFSGTITAINQDVGSRVEADQVLCQIDVTVSLSDQAQSAGDDQSSKAATANTNVSIVDASDNQPEHPTAIDRMRQEKRSAHSAQSDGDAVAKSPSVRRKMKELDLNETSLKTNEPGRITHDDIHKHVQSRKDAQRSDEVQPTSARQDRSVPMTSLRQTIAKRLMESQHQTASLTTFNEVDLGKVIDLRARYKDEFKDRYGVKLGFMSFFTKACCYALQSFPEVNASVDDLNIVYHDYCDIGIAVSTDKGLLVPIIRDADQLDMADIEKRILDFSERARSNKISLDDLKGGTFSITNGGVFGSMLSTPILNPPQSAILGMHNIVKRPVVVDNAIQIRPMMYLALTYDHRIVDGSQAVRFLVMVKDLLEDPDRLLLQI